MKIRINHRFILADQESLALTKKKKKKINLIESL